MNGPGQLEAISKEEVKELLEDGGEPSISIFIPTEQAPVEPEENSLHLKSCLPQIEKRLLNGGFRRPEAADLLAPLVELLEDRRFWQQQLGGLALFRTRASFRYFRLPYEVRERYVVADHVYVKPLFPVLYPQSYFYVLALSHNALRLLECSRHGYRPVDLKPLDIPTSLAEALRYDDLQKPELQHHPTTGPGRGPEGQTGQGGEQGRTHGFHGHGESGEAEKTQISGFFQAADTGIRKLLGSSTAPLVLYGVDHIRALYREVTGYRHTLDEGVDGSPDRLRDAELHEHALPLIEKRVQSELEDLKDRYETSSAHGQGSDEIQSVLLAASDGRVDSLLVDGDAELWGRFDVDARSVEVGDGSSDTVELTDLAARLVFLASGNVYVLPGAEVPGTSGLAAIFRY